MTILTACLVFGTGKAFADPRTNGGVADDSWAKSTAGATYEDEASSSSSSWWDSLTNTVSSYGVSLGVDSKGHVVGGVTINGNMDGNSANQTDAYGTYGTGAQGLTGTATAKCGTSGQFTEIGGVCFPANTGLASTSISGIITNLFYWLMGLFTTIAVIAFVISGIQYLTSAGDEDMMQVAKRNAKYSLLGVLIGLSGFVIVKAIAAALSGSYLF